MSQSQRQSELFAGNDWTAVYRAFTEVNLNAFDFTSIRAAMVDYIRLNYPEDFNDWIESSEFVALIDLLAYLGQSLAFRMDINARENFLETARRRESVLRLARSLSYNATRNYPARGLAKITEIRTTHDVYDSTGTNLNNIAIKWDDANNPDWFEQWVLVLNASLIATNPFGVPLKTETISGIENQLYRFDNIATSAGNFPFSTTINSQSYSFDVVNADFNVTYGFVEQMPDPNASFHIIYQSDGNGNSSINTGFFVYFKQGNLQKVDYGISEPQENRMIYLDATNINETDVWVHSVDDLGALLADGEWTRVGYVPSDDLVKVLLTAENITYNSVDPTIQTIYQVLTQANDGIALRFGDGRFGKSPVGNLRVWYRVSANENLSIRPEDIQGVSINVPFYAKNNTQKSISLNFSLQETVGNGVSTETNDEIRRRASQVYSTQGRMVSGADYNELPVQTNLAVKLKAVNRVYSGQSRFIDLNDPTGSYQNTNVFSDDGAFYLYNEVQSTEVNNTTVSVAEIMSNYLQSAISSLSLQDFYHNYLFSTTPDAPFYYTNDYLNKTEVNRLVTENLQLNRSFALGFDNTTSSDGWYVLSSSEVNPDLTADYAFIDSNSPGPNSWLVYCEYTSDFWRITARGLFFVFESLQDCRFYFSNDFKSIDPQTGRAGSDTITILRKPNNLATDLVFKLEDMFVNPDGFLDPTKVKVRFNDGNGDGLPDVPNSFKVLKDSASPNSSIVHQSTVTTDGYPVLNLVKRLVLDTSGNIFTQLQPNEFGFLELSDHTVKIYAGDSVNLRPTASNVLSFTQASDNTGSPAILAQSATPYTLYRAGDLNPYQFVVGEGVDDLIFQWRHFAPSNHRIDPAVSNIIDIFVLTNDFNDLMTSWRNAGADPLARPKAPTELSLRTTFSALEDYKMFSDEIIWRPVKFKLLFGQTADPQYQAKFKIVTLNGTSLSDGEIKSQVIDSMRTFFDVNNWDFGETFFYSELGAYIHRELATSISSIEIVPVLSDSYFGNLREIRCAPDELFFVTAQVSDIDIITANTPTNLRIK